jgi:Peptidase family M23
VRLAVIVAALTCAAISLQWLVVPSRAAGYDWDGGSDVVGWSAPAKSIYFAEGTTRDGFEEFLLLRNPGPAACVANVKYIFGSHAPQYRRVPLAAGAGTSINVNSEVGPGKDVSVSITSDPPVIAERQIYFNYKGVWTGGHASSGVRAPSDNWYFAEGTTRAGFQEWLCLQNPTGAPVSGTITYMLQTGENKSERVVIAANARKTIDVNSSVGPDQDVSILVKTSTPIIAERPMYFDYKSACRGGHTCAGAAKPASTWYFAEGTTRDGFHEWLCIMNPGGATVAKVEYMFADAGEDTLVRTYKLGAKARTTVFVNDAVGPERDVSIKVTCGSNIICERPMYFRYGGALEGGHDVLGSTAGARTWNFPASCAGPGFQSWLCIMNSGDTANNVMVEVFGDGGSSKREGLRMAAGTRATIDLNAASDGLKNPWVRVTGSRQLIAERPVYFSYEPRAESQPFAFAAWRGINLISPIRFRDNVGAIFHEATTESEDGKPANTQAMQPLGTCLEDDNPSRLYPGISSSPGGETMYFIEDTRGRGTYSTTACDVSAKAGTTAYAPVNGTVIEARSYLLYGKYPDLLVRISIDGFPGFHFAMLHMSDLLVSAGQRVQAGKTPVGIVRDLVPYFHSGPNPYTREEGNHVHVQINYRPDMSPGSGAAGTTP